MAIDLDHELEQTLIAATLVAASLAVLFVLWQPDVAKALDQKTSPAGNANDGVARRKVRFVLFAQSLLLLATTAITFFILLHQVWPILIEAIGCLGFCPLDHVKALAVINVVVVGLLAVGLFGQFGALWTLWRKLGGLTWLISYNRNAK